MTVHRCPIGDAYRTPCCDRSVFELDGLDQMTVNDELVTCRARHPVTGRFLARDCEIDCQDHCAGLCGAA